MTPQFYNIPHLDKVSKREYEQYKVVDSMTPRERLLYWVYERHNIHLKKEDGEEPPWTDDPVLRRYFFTNPYRENDKTTVWFREYIRDHLRERPEVIFATVCFRWFNLIETGLALLGNPPMWLHLGELLDTVFCKWSSKTARKLLANQPKVFTGAYMINTPGGRPKLDVVLERLDTVWKDRDDLADSLLFCDPQITLEVAHQKFMEYPNIGPFMSYEIVTDLRHTYVLEDCDDINTWASLGPGAIRGIRRLLGLSVPEKNVGNMPEAPPNVLDIMKELREWFNDKLPASFPVFEMREVEHTLCEFDKYERARTGVGGQLKRKYKGH